MKYDIQFPEWTRRILEWNMRGPRKRGRPAYTWETALQKYSIWKGFNNWIVEAAGREHWMLMKRDFVFFTLHNRWSKNLNSICLRPKGAAFGPASFDLTWLDIQFQKFVRRIVEPAPGTNWSAQYSAMAWYFAWVEYARGLLGPCQWNCILVKKVRDWIPEFRFLHCKFSSRTLGEESVCVATTSNTSFPWTPTAGLGH